MGINLWFAPQISEHWPYIKPGRLIKIDDWFKRPGTASTFTPIEGIAQEWRTSEDVIINRTWVLNGKIIWLSVSINRNSLSSNPIVGFI